MRFHSTSCLPLCHSLCEIVAWCALPLALGACGAKTGLEVPDVVLARDGAADVVDASDAPVVPLSRVTQCFPIRVHARLGFVTSLRPDADTTAASGYQWTLTARPMASRAMLATDGSSIAFITPDQVGEYDVMVNVPASRDAGGSLQCPITVIADPPNPECPGYALTEPRSVLIPGGDMQAGYDVAWRPPRVARGADVGAVLSEDPDTRVDAVVFERAASADTTDVARALETEGGAVEQALIVQLSAVGVLVGRNGVTHEGFPMRRSTMRVTTMDSPTPGQLRDRALTALTGLQVMPEPVSSAPAQDFYVEVATLLRPDTHRVVVALAFAPVVAADDNTLATGIRIEDFANATAFARADSTLEVRCHAITATRTLMADFLWFVDTSASMEPHQERVGRTAEQFFANLNADGVDFRVGVIEAGNSTPVLEGSNGGPAFHWISGSDPDGARLMAWQVTAETYPGEPADQNLAPFPTDDTRGECPSNCHEEPIAEAVLTVQEFERRRAAGETNPDFLLRDHAARAVFFITDEPGTDNDYDRFFAVNARDWGGPVSDANPGPLLAAIETFFNARSVVPFGLVPEFAGSPCPSLANMHECLISATGGAFVPIHTPSDADSDRQVAAAMERVVDSIAGQASEYILPSTPISSSLRARVNGRMAPRSRADGFDYQEHTRALIFRGASFRPHVGDFVQTAYFVWEHP